MENLNFPDTFWKARSTKNVKLKKFCSYISNNVSFQKVVDMIKVLAILDMVSTNKEDLVNKVQTMELLDIIVHVLIKLRIGKADFNKLMKTLDEYHQVLKRGWCSQWMEVS